MIRDILCIGRVKRNENGALFSGSFEYPRVVMFFSCSLYHTAHHASCIIISMGGGDDEMMERCYCTCLN